MVNDRIPSALHRKQQERDVEDELNAKDAFQANLQAKLKSLRQAPKKKIATEDDEFVGLTRKVKRKRSEAPSIPKPVETNKAKALKPTKVVLPQNNTPHQAFGSVGSNVDCKKTSKELSTDTGNQKTKSDSQAVAQKSKSKNKKKAKFQKILAGGAANNLNTTTTTVIPSTTTPSQKKNIIMKQVVHSSNVHESDSEDESPTRKPINQNSDKTKSCSFAKQIDLKDVKSSGESSSEGETKFMPLKKKAKLPEPTSVLEKSSTKPKTALQAPKVIDKTELKPLVNTLATKDTRPTPKTISEVKSHQISTSKVVKSKVVVNCPEKAALKSIQNTKVQDKALSNKKAIQKSTKPLTSNSIKSQQSSSPIPKEYPTKSVSLEDAAKAMKRLQSQPQVNAVNTVKIKDIDGDAKASLYASIIDAAAMEQWDLVEMGRLVRLFCAPFHFKRKKTTRFLRKHCPEFVCADFLEGLNIPLHGFQIVELLRAGSPAPRILSAKIATCIEADVIKISDDSVLDAFVDLIDLATMSKDEIFDFAHGLIESLRTVGECCRVLKGMTQHWALEDIRHLVQRIILSPVFDDLEGDHEATVKAAFPMLSKLEFPSRLDMDDTNADGNLDDLCVDDNTIEYDHSSHESDDALDEMEARINSKTKTTKAIAEEGDEDEDEKDTDEEDDDAQGESDSDEDLLPHWNSKAAKSPRQRSRFILDEASEDEDDLTGDEDVESSDSDSD